MDKVIDKIAALGVPGLVLVAAMGFTGYVGAAAVTAALAVLGGPLGMLGGIAALVVLALISRAITQYGFEKILAATVRRLHEKGVSTQEIRTKVQGYPISRMLKMKLLAYLDGLS